MVSHPVPHVLIVAVPLTSGVHVNLRSRAGRTRGGPKAWTRSCRTFVHTVLPRCTVFLEPELWSHFGSPGAIKAALRGLIDASRHLHGVG